MPFINSTIQEPIIHRISSGFGSAQLWKGEQSLYSDGGLPLDSTNDILFATLIWLSKNQRQENSNNIKLKYWFQSTYLK